MKQPFKVDYLYAAVCILGAVYFIFRNPRGSRGGGGVPGLEPGRWPVILLPPRATAPRTERSR